MGVRYQWADDQKIILNVCVEHPWTWDEYIAATNVLTTLLADVKHPCATIVDVTKYGSLPEDGNVIRNLLRVETALPDNVFASALVGAPFGLSVFMNMLSKLRPRVKTLAIFTDTAEEAREKILERYHQMELGSPGVSS